MECNNLQISFEKKNKRVTIGELNYGTIVGDVPHRQPQAIYMKVNKKVGTGISLHWSRDNCLLLNLKSGTIRQIPYNSEVTVYNGELTLSIATENLQEHLKD